MVTNGRCIDRDVVDANGIKRKQTKHLTAKTLTNSLNINRLQQEEEEEEETKETDYPNRWRSSAQLDQLRYQLTKQIKYIVIKYISKISIINMI